MRRAAATATAGAGAGLAAAAPAGAHSFAAGADAYALFVEAVGVPASEPPAAVALVALGLMAGIWHPDGMPRIWPALIAGAVVGVLAAPAVALPLGLPLLLLAVLTGGLGALALDWPRALPAGLAAVIAALAGALSLAGHAWGTLPLAVHAGVLVGINLLVTVPAGLVAGTRRSIAAAWPMIVWRALASWAAAVAILVAAFELAA